MMDARTKAGDAERKLLVLTFHRVDDAGRATSHGVPWAVFRDLLEWAGGAAAQVARTFTPEEIDRPSILLRFDDGTVDHARAADELAERGMRGIFFISSGRLHERGFVDARTVRVMCEAGHVIGSHAHTHVPLAAKPVRYIHEELHRSKAILEDLTGQRVDFIAPPGGLVDRSVREIAQAAGYRGLTTMRWGLCRGRWNSFDVPTVPVTAWTVRNRIAERTYAANALPWDARAVCLLRAMLPEPLRRRGRTLLNSGGTRSNGAYP
jgi:peptidoglycan/xylan/chitin deacetylase (PgdA/CDA1 family)